MFSPCRSNQEPAREIPESNFSACQSPFAAGTDPAHLRRAALTEPCTKLWLALRHRPEKPPCVDPRHRRFQSNGMGSQGMIQLTAAWTHEKNGDSACAPGADHIRKLPQARSGTGRHPKTNSTQGQELRWSIATSTILMRSALDIVRNGRYILRGSPPPPQRGVFINTSPAFLSQNYAIQQLGQHPFSNKPSLPDDPGRALRRNLGGCRSNTSSGHFYTFGIRNCRPEWL